MTYHRVHPRFIAGSVLLALQFSVQCFVHCCLSFCPFSFDHCFVWPSSIDGFWLLLWELQILLMQILPKWYHAYLIWIIFKLNYKTLKVWRWWWFAWWLRGQFFWWLNYSLCTDATHFDWNIIYIIVSSKWQHTMYMYLSDWIPKWYQTLLNICYINAWTFNPSVRVCFSWHLFPFFNFFHTAGYEPTPLVHYIIDSLSIKTKHLDFTTTIQANLSVWSPLLSSHLY